MRTICRKRHRIARRLTAVAWLCVAMFLCPMQPIRAQGDSSADGNPQTASTAPMPGAAGEALFLTPDQAILSAIREEGRLQVETMMEGLPETRGPMFEQVQALIRRMKVDSEARFLAEIARQAKGRSEEAIALAAERYRDQLLQPTRPDSSVPQSPDRDMPQNGGGR